jgi:hypothetical protein
MRNRLAAAALVLGLLAGMPPAAVRAAVVIISNRTDQEVRFTVATEQGAAKEYRLASGDLIPIPVAGSVDLTFTSGALRRQYRVDPNAAYYFGDFSGRLDLQEIGITRRPTPPAAAGLVAKLPATGTIPVKLLVDEDDPRAQRVWEAQLRKRLEAASDIVEKHCRLRFEVVAVGTWESDNAVTDFQESLREFEREVNPHPARLAIGFTSQYRAPIGRTHLGGTRGTLHTHILVREWVPPTESERMEVLLHELGHHLGAAHSPEPISVMRPLLGDGKGMARQFRIGFDPVNTLAMYLVGEEIRARGVKSVRELSAQTCERLLDVYAEIARVLPEDPVAAEYVKLLRGPAAVLGAPTSRLTPLAEGTRAVLTAVVQAAETNQRRPARLTGDALTEHYFRTAAAAARRLPPEQGVAAYLVALGFGLDDSEVFRKNPLTRDLSFQVESDAERKHRLAVLGSPTMRGRRDWAQHFVVSCTLTALIGPQFTEATGIFKEQLDARGGSGFSFADIAANLAGIAFANRLRETAAVPAELADSFRVADYLPEATGLKEGLAWEKFAKDYGSTSDARFRAELTAIWKRVQALPGHQGGTKASGGRQPPG